MLQSHPSIHPNTANKRFKFEPFLQREHGFSLNPDRPICQFYSPSNPTSCPNGVMCPNKHVPAMYNNKIVCKHWLRGLCKKNNRCEFLHEYNLRKMPECLFYSKNGFCTQTPECLYLHIDPQSKIAECVNYNRGYCPEGPKCTKRHIRRVLCPSFLTGFCPKGTECEFSHPKWDSTTITRLKIKSDEEFMRELQEKKQELQKLRQRQTAHVMKREHEDDEETKEVKKQKVE